MMYITLGYNLHAGPVTTDEVVDPPARFTSVIPWRARVGVGLTLGGFGLVYRRCRH